MLNKLLNTEIQRRLDFLDEFIDTLGREKQAEGDEDLSVIEEAKGVQQTAREHYSRGDLKKAWTGIYWAESCILVGQSDLASYRKVSAEIEELLG